MNRRWLLVGAASLALTNIGLSSARAAEDKEQDEQKISFKDAPKAVRKTLKRESNGTPIKTLDKEKLNGKTVYEADVEIDDHNYEIVVDPKGLLLSKKLDNEADEKGGAREAEDEDDAKPAHGKKKVAKEAEEQEESAKATHSKKAGKEEDEDEDKSTAKKVKSDDREKEDHN